MRLNTPGILNRLGKKITPVFGRMAANPALTNFIELTCAYLNCLIGKGSGTGWDRGEEIAAARIIRRENPVVLDLGANRGLWTAEVRRLTGGKGRWILVDAAAECCKLLRQMEGVEVIEAAVGEHPGKAVLFTPGEGSGLASLHKRQDSFVIGQAMQTREVAVTTLDQILTERGINEVDLVKMDLEGHEFFALRGATQALKRGHIRALTFEFGSSNVNSRTYFHDFWDLLSTYGFEIKRIYPGGAVMKVSEYYEDLECFRGVTNYLAVLR